METAQTKACGLCKASFVIEADNLAFYQKIGVQEPDWCPTCRFRCRCLFRNERSLYNRICALCKKPMISMFNPNRPYTVYCGQCWESDTWDRASYAIDYDQDRSFLDQLAELFQKVPKKTLYITTGLGPNTNSDYTNMAGGLKNCYLVFNTGRCEDTMYSRGLLDCRDTSDAYFGSQLERCYDVVNAQQCAGVLCAQNVVGCLDSAYLLNCSGCSNCFACVNLRNKSYYFFNEPLEKEEYKRRMEDILGSYKKMQDMRRQFDEFAKKFPRRENNNIRTIDSVGDYLFEGKNLFNCFETSESENCKFMFSTKMAKDCYDCVGYSYNSELLLEDVSVGVSNRVVASFGCENSQDLTYCANMKQSKECFGCDGLKNASFCILNKQYTPEEYKARKERIINELKADNCYGSFFPPLLAYFAYNETIAQDNARLTRQEAGAYGFRWEEHLQMTKGKETKKLEELPDHIKDMPVTIVNEILACADCARNYRVIPQELEFYRRMNISVPRQCFNCRFLDRIRRRGPYAFFERSCERCSKKITTNLTIDHAPIVYCENCYQNEVA